MHVPTSSLSCQCPQLDIIYGYKTIQIRNYKYIGKENKSCICLWETPAVWSPTTVPACAPAITTIIRMFVEPVFACPYSLAKSHVRLPQAWDEVWPVVGRTLIYINNMCSSDILTQVNIYNRAKSPITWSQQHQDDATHSKDMSKLCNSYPLYTSVTLPSMNHFSWMIVKCFTTAGMQNHYR